MCLPVEPVLSIFRETVYVNENGGQHGTPGSLPWFPFSYAVLLNANRASSTRLGVRDDSLKYVNCVLAHWTVLSTFGETAYVNGNGGQHGTTRLYATDLLFTNLQKVYLYPKIFVWCVKGTQCRSPLHQHSEKKVQVMKKKRVWEETIKIVPK